MRFAIILEAVLLLCACLGLAQTKQQKPAAPAKQMVKLPPESIVFANTYGEVTYTHRKHYERVGGDCSTCHTSVFQQSREDINYKKALHRAAEASKKSCAACHRVGGSAFAADSNCTKCHASKYQRTAGD